jgi:pseudaminic acid synthase
MFKVRDRNIGKGYKPFIIAEISANHGGSIERAKDTILAAHQAGADAVKLQSYTPDTMTIKSHKSDFMITEGLWQGQSLYELYEQAHTPFEWHEELFAFAEKNRIILMSTPFDETAVDLLVDLDVPAFKIASFEITDLPLVEYVASKHKPVFISTGLANIDEISDAIECCYQRGNKNILLFHCISNYPADVRDSKLGDITYLAEYFGVEVGLSDHTPSNLAPVLAIAKGASAIEKHFKLENTDCGPDASFSISKKEFRELCIDCETAFEALKSDNLSRTTNELMNIKYRRSIYFIRDLKKGDKITREDIKRIRPGYGLEPKYFDLILGKVVTEDVENGDPVSFDILSGF